MRRPSFLHCYRNFRLEFSCHRHRQPRHVFCLQTAGGQHAYSWQDKYANTFHDQNSPTLFYTIRPPWAGQSSVIPVEA